MYTLLMIINFNHNEMMRSKQTQAEKMEISLSSTSSSQHKGMKYLCTPTNHPYSPHFLCSREIMKPSAGNKAAMEPLGLCCLASDIPSCLLEMKAAADVSALKYGVIRCLRLPLSRHSWPRRKSNLKLHSSGLC